MFNIFKRKQKKTPSRNQVKLCEQLGLKIYPKMGQADVSKLLGEALQQEKYKAIYDSIQLERERKFEKEDREEYGDEIVNELKSWEAKFNSDSHFYLVFKRGKTIHYDIAELESADIAGSNKYYIELNFQFPKRYKDKVFGDYVEWEKDITIRAHQVLKIQSLNRFIDGGNIKEYESAKMQCEVLATQVET